MYILTESLPHGRRLYFTRLGADDGSILAIPIGQIAVGPVALAIGTESTLLVAAGLVVLAVLGMLAGRDVRRLESGAPAQPETPRSTAPKVQVGTPGQ
jgi:hypothetical protein